MSTQSHIVTRADIVQLWDAINNLRDRLPAADIPAPPREKTQGEADDAAFQEWREVAPTSPAYMAWHAALAYERAEVLRLLPPPRPLVNYGTGIMENERAIEAIRARCGGAK